MGLQKKIICLLLFQKTQTNENFCKLYVLPGAFPLQSVSRFETCAKSNHPVVGPEVQEGFVGMKRVLRTQRDNRNLLEGQRSRRRGRGELIGQVEVSMGMHPSPTRKMGK